MVKHTNSKRQCFDFTLITENNKYYYFMYFLIDEETKLNNIETFKKIN